MLFKNKVALLIGYDSLVNKDGIGQYSEILFDAIQTCSNRLTVSFEQFNPSGIWGWLIGLIKIFRSYDCVHMQYPVEAWGTSVLPGVFPGLLKVLMKKKLIVTFHEWMSMHPLRKISVLPLAYFCDSIIFVSKSELDAFSRSWIYRVRLKRPSLHLIPIGVNIDIPEVDSNDILAFRQDLLSINNCEVIFGFFGFVYGWKQLDKILDSLVYLLQSGLSVSFVICGEFPDDHLAERDRFFTRVSTLGLTKVVDFRGFVADESELTLIQQSCNCVVLLFSDGVSARRGSFWTVLEMGVPLITTKPISESEFEGLIDIASLESSGAIFMVEPTISSKSLANIMRGYSEYKAPICARGISPNWAVIAQSHLRLYSDV